MMPMQPLSLANKKDSPIFRFLKNLYIFLRCVYKFQCAGIPVIENGVSNGNDEKIDSIMPTTTIDIMEPILCLIKPVQTKK